MEAERKGEPLAMTRKVYGPSSRVQEEMSKQGRAMPRPERTDTAMSKEQLISQGRDLVLSGKVNPEKEMRVFEKNGRMSMGSTSAFRYWGYRLQQISDDLNDRNPRSAAAKAAMERSSQWQRRIEQSSYQMFAKTGHSLQGENEISPDNMKSTTFVTRQLKKAKAIREGKNEDDVEIDEGEEASVRRVTRQVKQSEEVRELTSAGVGQVLAKESGPKLDPGQMGLGNSFREAVRRGRIGAEERLNRKKPGDAAMAMKGASGELPKLDAETEDELANVGVDVMVELSEKNDLTDARWREEMKKAIYGKKIDRPDLEPYLDHIRAVSEEIRNTALNNYIGTGSSVQDVRALLTRKRPDIKVSIAAIHRALKSDPTGQHITPAEAYHIWNYIKQRFLDHVNPETGKVEPILDFRRIRNEASDELGIRDTTTQKITNPYTQIRLFRAMATNRTMRQVTEELVKRMQNEARIKGQAMNWLKNQEYPWWLRTMRKFPRYFFLDKIVGHGFVPMITHSPTMLFNPKAWSVYFGHVENGKWVPGAWQEMYRMSVGEQPFRRIGAAMGVGKWEGMTGERYHYLMTEELKNKYNFQDWKQAGLQCDPFKYTDDYQIEWLQNKFGGKLNAWIGGRGFDALKTLRYAMAEKWLQSMPEHLRNGKSMELIADSVNHATGIVQTRFHESLNWLMFAPKLEASRWAWLFKDNAKALNYVTHWRTASLEQRAWATSQLKQTGSVFAAYAVMLALNQAFLGMFGSDQKINITDPTKPDFLAFKAAGFKVGVASPFIGMFRLFANALHATVGERTKFERLTPRQKQLMQVVGQYGRGKMSPLASFATEMGTAQDYANRPLGFLPWSEPLARSQRLRGETPYAPGEYALETFAPIPLEEAIKNTFLQQGMTESEANSWIHTLIIAGGMSATGARISRDVQR